MDKSVLYLCVRSAAVAAAPSAVCCYCCRFSFCYVDMMCGFTTEYLDLIDYKFVLFVRCCTTYEYVIRRYLPAAAVYEMCFAILLLLQLLLLDTAARHRVLDGKKYCFGSLHLIPVFSISSFKHNLFSGVPLGSAVAFTASLFT